ncbi:MAG: tripartite tricarboxylate transporter substrate binding protein [Betaproteobacteria bacterium]
MRSAWIASALLALNMAAGDGVAAERVPSYPVKPVRIIAPFPPGGPGDIVARDIGQRLTEIWGQQVVVDNRAGAGGMIAHELLARSAPDGYTLIMGSSGALVIQPLMSAKLPYDPVKDFAPVSKVIVAAHALVLYPQVAANSVRELITLAKARPGQLNFASAGVGSATQLSGELFKAMAEINIVHVPYKGGVPALTDIVAGQVQFMFNSIPPVLPFSKIGKLKIIAVSSANRIAILPETATVAETLPGFQSGVWYAIFAPTGTPPSIVHKLSAEIIKILAEPELTKRLVATPMSRVQFLLSRRASNRKAARRRSSPA